MTQKLSRAVVRRWKVRRKKIDILTSAVLFIPPIFLFILIEQSSYQILPLLASLAVATCVSICLTNIYIVTRLTDLQILMETKK